MKPHPTRPMLRIPGLIASLEANARLSRRDERPLSLPQARGQRASPARAARQNSASGAGGDRLDHGFLLAPAPADRERSERHDIGDDVGELVRQTLALEANRK